MPGSPARFLARASRARATARFAVLAGGAYWVIDSVVDVLLSPGHRLVDQLLAPGPLEIWIRLLVTALLVVLYRSRLTSKRLHLFSAALAAAPDGIQIADLAGTIVYSNDAVRRLYGWAPDELVGRNVNELNADPTFATRVVLPELARRGRWEGELEVRSKDGRVFPIWLTTSVIADRRGRPHAAIGVIRDVSERNRAQRELRDYAHRLEEATALKDLFADILRHDLLGPATTIQLSLDALLKRETDPATRRVAEGGRRGCAKLIDMIEGVSKYAKLSAARQLDFGVVDLGAVLREIVADTELQSEQRNARIVLEAPGEHLVRANPVIREIFENLVSNAVKYGPVSGTIRIAVHDEGGRWRVSVADQGEGIGEEDKGKIFTRFERLRKEGVKGTGLGLAIAKRIVDLHGGAIWVEDAPGGGAIFCVALDKAAAQGGAVRA